MIFEDIKNIENSSINERIEMFGSKQKQMAAKNRCRSNMMLNPLNLKHLNRIDNLEADCITLNLEDAIAPSRKQEALINIALFLSHMDSSKSFIIVRTNPMEQGGLEEIEYLNDFAFDAIRLSKVKTPQDIKSALGVLSSDKELHISLETKEAFSDIASLKIDDRFTTANLGILDLLSSLGLPQSLLKIGNATIDHILTKFLLECKMSDLQAVSFMYQDYKDVDGFKRWCEYEKSLGFSSKACMGPQQVKIANSVFDIEKYDIERASYIKEIFEQNSANGINGFMDDRYGFIDEPIYKDALLLLNNIKEDK